VFDTAVALLPGGDVRPSVNEVSSSPTGTADVTPVTLVSGEMQVDVSRENMDFAVQIDESCLFKDKACDVEQSADDFLADGWSELRYVDVNINGISGAIQTLDDSGAQLCLVKASVIAPLCLKKIGPVVLRDFFGNAYQASVVCLQMKLANANQYLPVVCAVCDNLNSDLLLGSDVVDTLNRSWLDEQSPVISLCKNDDVCDENYMATDVMANEVEVETSPANNDDNEVVLDLNDLSGEQVTPKDENVANADQLALEQRNDQSLALCFSLAERNRAGYYVRNGILYRK